MWSAAGVEATGAGALAGLAVAIAGVGAVVFGALAAGTVWTHAGEPESSRRRPLVCCGKTVLAAFSLVFAAMSSGPLADMYPSVAPGILMLALGLAALAPPALVRRQQQPVTIASAVVVAGFLAGCARAAAAGRLEGTVGFVAASLAAGLAAAWRNDAGLGAQALPRLAWFLTTGFLAVTLAPDAHPAVYGLIVGSGVLAAATFLVTGARRLLAPEAPARRERYSATAAATFDGSSRASSRGSSRASSRGSSRASSRDQSDPGTDRSSRSSSRSSRSNCDSAADGARDSAADNTAGFARHPTKPGGAINVMVGPMFAGKTSELIRVVRREMIHSRTCIVRPTTDRRGHASHEIARELPAEAVVFWAATAAAVTADVAGFDVVAVDECQFLPDLAEEAEHWAARGQRVYAFGLDSRFDREPFPATQALMSRADVLKKIHAVCHRCGAPAAWSHRLVADQHEVVLGGSESYQALCRSCYQLAARR